MTFEKTFYQDLKKPLLVRHCEGIVMNNDSLSNTISVVITDNGEAATVSGTVVGAAIRCDGATVAIEGTLSGNTVAVTLPAAALSAVGPMALCIQIVDDGVKTTVLKAIFTVDRGTTDTVVDPSGEITLQVADLINAIEDAIEAIPEDYSDLETAVRRICGIYGANSKESFVSMTEVIVDKTVASVNGAFKLVDNDGTYVLKIPTSVLLTDPFLIVHPNNMVIVGTTYQVFWSDSDAFTSSARRTFSTDTAVVRRSDSNNGDYDYIYIPVSSPTPSYVINRPISSDEVPYDFFNLNHNNETGFSVNATSGILDYGGTAKISQAFYLNDALYASDSINLFIYNTDGSYNTKIVLVVGKNDTSTHSGKIGVIAKSGSKVVTYDINSRVNMINRRYIDSTKFAKSWTGKTLYCYGDSVTEQGYWQPYLNRVCGFESVINGGHSGYRLMALATSENIDAITDPFDIMVVMAGINDWTQDRQIGTISDVNTDSQSFTGTFYGALNQMLSYLTTKWPARRFVFITPTYVWLNDDSKFFSGTGHGDVNSNGNTMRDFADAMIAACKKWNVPCIDILSQIGWNKNNISTYVKNDATTTGGVTYANYSHPDWAGAKIMASIIASYLESIAPIL